MQRLVRTPIPLMRLYHSRLGSPYTIGCDSCCALLSFKITLEKIQFTVSFFFSDGLLLAHCDTSVQNGSLLATL